MPAPSRRRPRLDEIDDYDKPMVRYFGLDPDKVTVEEFKAAFNPYRYGFPVEIAVKEDGSYTVAKHHAMGRVAVELAKVMPDQKTAYISDDGTNVGLFMFIADTAGNLDAGKLYAAKWNQTSADARRRRRHLVDRPRPCRQRHGPEGDRRRGDVHRPLRDRRFQR